MLLRPLTESLFGERVARGAGLSVAVGLALLLAACASAPAVPDRTTASSDVSPEATTRPLESDAATGSPEGGAGAKAPPGAAGGAASGTALPPQPEIPKRALSDFDRAVGLMRSGNAGEAELEFKQLAVGYPQLVGAQINIALLQRKANRLEEAEATLKAAVEKNPGSAVAWNELGLTQRMRGQFQDAAASYEKAIAANDTFAPAHRNYAVLLDLYLGDPERALTELERYKELTGEDKPVTGWIAELRQRTGKPPAPRPGAAPADAAPADATAPADDTAPASSETPPQPAAEPTAPRAGPSQPRAGGTTARAVVPAVISAQSPSGKGA